MYLHLRYGKKIVAIISTTGRKNRGGLDVILRRLYILKVLTPPKCSDEYETLRNRRTMTARIETPWKSLSNVICLFHADVIRYSSSECLRPMCSVYYILLYLYDDTIHYSRDYVSVRYNDNILLWYDAIFSWDGANSTGGLMMVSSNVNHIPKTSRP